MKTINRVSKEQGEKIDNLIITMIKIYPFNIDHALRRVSELEGVTLGNCRLRWYNRLKWKHPDVFKLTSQNCEVYNTKSICSEKLDEETLQKIAAL
jgi:hypothetical protein